MCGLWGLQEDYDDCFIRLREPAVTEFFGDDQAFAEQRISGVPSSFGPPTASVSLPCDTQALLVPTARACCIASGWHDLVMFPRDVPSSLS